MGPQVKLGQQILWLTIGILTGIVLANLGLFGGSLILVGLLVLGYHRGLRIALFCDNQQNNNHKEDS